MKKLTIVLLLLMCSIVWGVPRTLYPNRTTMDWSDAKWKQTDDLPEGVEVEPIDGDTVIFTTNSGTVTMTGDSANALDAFTMTGGTLVGNDGTQRTLYVDGDYSCTVGTLTNVVLNQGDDGDGVSCTNNQSGQPLKEYNIEASTNATLVGHYVFIKKFTLGAGSTCSSGILYVLGTDDVDFFATNDITVGSAIALTLWNSRTNVGTVKTSAGLLFVAVNAAVLTQSGDVTTAGLQLYGATGGSFKLDGTPTVDFGAVNFGDGTTKYGTLDLNGKDAVADSVGQLGSGTNSLVFGPGGSGDLNVGGNVDLTAMTVTASSASTMEVAGNLTFNTALPNDLTVTMDGTDKTLTGIATTNRADLDVNSGGTITVQDAQSWDSIDLSAGTLDLADYAVILREGLSGAAIGGIDIGISDITIGGTFDGTDITVTGHASLPATFHGDATGAGPTISNLTAPSGAWVDARAINGDSIADGGGNDNVRFARGFVGGGTW